MNQIDKQQKSLLKNVDGAASQIKRNTAPTVALPNTEPRRANVRRTSASEGAGNYLSGMTSTKWYAGEQPTLSEALARVADIGSSDAARGRDLYGQLMGLTSDPTTPFYAPYLNATNGNISAIAELGIDVSGGITQEWLDRNAYLMQYYNPGVSGTPTSGGSAQNKAAYYYYQILKDEETTRAAESEMAALQEEMAYWAGRTDRNFSDEEILGMIDWSEYSTLTGMQEAAQLGTPTQLNRGVGFTGDYSGMLWAARNGGSSGNPLSDMANASRGVGAQYEENPEITARLDPTSGRYNPYVVGSTMDSETRFFGVESFSPSWLETNRGRISDAQAQYERVYDAEETTRAAEDELAALTEALDGLVDYSTDELMQRAQEWIEDGDDYPTLRRMLESLATGDLLPTTRAIPFDIESLVAQGVRNTSYLPEHVKTGIEADDAAIAVFRNNLKNAAGYIHDFGSEEEKIAFKYGAPEGEDAAIAEVLRLTSGETAVMQETADNYYSDNYFSVMSVLDTYDIDTSSIEAAEESFYALVLPWGFDRETSDPRTWASFRNPHAREVASIQRAISEWRTMQENEQDFGLSESGRSLHAAADFARTQLPQTDTAWVQNAGVRADISGGNAVYSAADISQAQASLEAQRSTLELARERLSGMRGAEDYLDRIDTNLARLDYNEALLSYASLRDAEDFRAVVSEMRRRQYAAGSMEQFLLHEADSTDRIQLGEYTAAEQREGRDALELYATQAELDTYAYILGTEGAEAAQEYLNFLLDPSYGVLSYRRYDELSKDFIADAREYPVASSVMSILVSPLQAAGNLAVFGEGEVNPYDPLFTAGDYVTTTRSTVSEEKIQTPFFRMLYNAGMSLGDSMLLATALPGLGTASAAFMGLEASANAIQQAKLSGATDREAISMGVATALAETITEVGPMSRLSDALHSGSVKNIRDFFANLAAGGVEEAIGESASELMTEVADREIMGALSTYEQAVRFYMSAEGGSLSEEDAEARASRDFVSRVLEAGLTGLLSGGAGGAISGGPSLVSNRRNGGTQETAAQSGAETAPEGAPVIEVQRLLALADVNGAQKLPGMTAAFEASGLERGMADAAAQGFLSRYGDRGVTELRRLYRGLDPAQAERFMEGAAVALTTPNSAAGHHFSQLMAGRVSPDAAFVDSFLAEADALAATPEGQTEIGTAIAKAERANRMQRYAAEGRLANLNSAAEKVQSTGRETHRMEQQLEVARAKAVAAGEHLEAMTEAFNENPSPQNAGELQQAMKASNAAVISVQQQEEGVKAVNERHSAAKAAYNAQAGQTMNELRREAGESIMQERAAQQQAEEDYIAADRKAELAERVKMLEGVAEEAKNNTNPDAVPLSDDQIIRRLSAETGLAIDTSRRSYERQLRDNTLGYTDTGTGVAHVQDKQNASTAIHELTHDLDERYRMHRDKPNGAPRGTYLREDPAFKALQPVFERMAGISDWLNLYSEAEKPGEVLARYAQIWLSNPKAAYDLSPDAYLAFENALREENRLKPFRRAQQDYVRLVNSSAAAQMAATMESLKDLGKKRPFAERRRALRPSKLVGKYTDRVALFRPLVRALEDLTGETVDMKDDVAAVLDSKDTETSNFARIIREEALVGPDGKPLINPKTGEPYGSYADMIGKIPADQLTDFNTLWKTLDSIDRLRANKPNTKQTLAELRVVADEIVERHPEMFDLVEDFVAWNNARKQAWIVDPVTPTTQAGFDHMKEMYPHHAPARKAEKIAAGKAVFGRNTENPANNPTDSAKGHDTGDTISPTDGILMEIERDIKYNRNLNVVRKFDAFLVQARGSRLGLGIADEVQEMDRVAKADETDPDVAFEPTTLITGEGILNVPLPDGTYRSWKITEEYRDLIPALLDDPATLPPFARLSRKVTALTGALMTAKNLVFQPKNLLADSETAQTTGFGPRWRIQMIVEMFKTGVELHRLGKTDYADWPEWYRDFMIRGSIGSRYSMRSPKTNAAFYRDALGSPSTPPSAKQKAKQTAANAGRFVTASVDNIGEFLDALVRATQARLVKVEGMDAESAALMRGRAAREASVDPTKRGVSSALQQVNAFVPFANMSVQGITKTLSLFSDPKRRGDIAKRMGIHAAEAFVLSVAKEVILRFIEEATWKGSEEEWEALQEITPYERSRYWHIPLGFTTLRLRKSQDATTVAAGLLGDLLADCVTGYEGDELGDFVDACYEVARTLIPFNYDSTIAQPVIDVARNRDTFGSAIDDGDWSNVSPRYQASPETAALYRWLGSSGLFGWSPDDWQYLSEQYLGYGGQMANGVMRFIEQAVGGDADASDLADVFIGPFRKAFSYDPAYSNGLSSTFYESRDLLETVVADAAAGEVPAGLRNGMTREEVDAAVSEARLLLSKNGTVGSTLAKVADLWDDYNEAVEADDTESADRVREQISLLYFNANAALGDWFSAYTTRNDNVVEAIANWFTPASEAASGIRSEDGGFTRVEGAFADDYDAGETYMTRAYSVHETFPDKATLPEPQRTFDVNSNGVKTHYEVPDNLWDDYVNVYRAAYQRALNRYSDAAWEAMTDEERLDAVQEARREGNAAAKEWYKNR